MTLERRVADAEAVLDARSGALADKALPMLVVIEDPETGALRDTAGGVWPDRGALPATDWLMVIKRRPEVPDEGDSGAA